MNSDEFVIVIVGRRKAEGDGDVCVVCACCVSLCF